MRLLANLSDRYFVHTANVPGHLVFEGLEDGEYKDHMGGDFNSSSSDDILYIYIYTFQETTIPIQGIFEDM